MKFVHGIVVHVSDLIYFTTEA